MNCNPFRKGTQTKLEQSYTLFWSSHDPRVDFKPVLDLIKSCDLEVIDMTYYSGESYVVDRRRHMTFGLRGTIQKLEMFELMACKDPKLAQFRDDSDI